MGIPLLSDITSYALRNIEHIPNYEIPIEQFNLNLPLVNEFAGALSALLGKNQNPSLYEPVVLAVEMMTALPIDSTLKYTGLKEETKRKLTVDNCGIYPSDKLFNWQDLTKNYLVVKCNHIK
ncbi:MAG: hypothetical protein LBS34_02580 [Rickettsiales bacterium]|jgi:hypothetical protein|nr:hypothetical protein [Rickettsiales bacterium]